MVKVGDGDGDGDSANHLAAPERWPLGYQRMFQTAQRLEPLARTKDRY